MRRNHPRRPNQGRCLAAPAPPSQAYETALANLPRSRLPLFWAGSGLYLAGLTLLVAAPVGRLASAMASIGSRMGSRMGSRVQSRAWSAARLAASEEGELLQEAAAAAAANGGSCDDDLCAPLLPRPS